MARVAENKTTIPAREARTLSRIYCSPDLFFGPLSSTRAGWMGSAERTIRGS